LNSAPAVPSIIAATQRAPTIDRAPVPENHDHHFRVQAGAYRVAENVTIARHQLERLGYRANVTMSGTLQLVSAGPFASRSEADRAATRMTKSGLEAIIVSDNHDRGARAGR
jgi:DedD protein